MTEPLENQDVFDVPIGEYTPQDLQQPCVDTYDVTKKMYALRALRDQTAQFKKQIDDLERFYNRKIGQIAVQEKWLKDNIDNWMAKEGQEKLVTPAGTAYYRKLEKWNWNEDTDKIEQYVKDFEPDLMTTKETEKFSLADLKKRIKEKGIVPQEIVTVIPETNLEIKLLG